MSQLKFVSAFSGIGGFDLGFERAGMKVVTQIENDKQCQKVLRAHWPDVPLLGDIRRVEAEALPQASVYCGGFPCQDVSVAGRHAGLRGENSGLFFEFLQLIEANLPRWVVIENVPGLLSSHGGRDMGTVLGRLAQLGYGVAWRIFDTRNFGVPQHRRRVFIVGCRRSLRGAAEVLFEPGSLHRSAAAHSAPVFGQDRRRTPISSYVCGWRDQKRVIYMPRWASTLMTHPGRNNPDQSWLVVVTAKKGEKSSVRVRKFMPIESERLQGFPDEWTAMLSDTARLRVLGNAVSVPVSGWIGERIIEIDALRRAKGKAA